MAASFERFASADSFELHYYFDNENVHSMNANVKHDNEKELLAIIKSVIQTLDLEIEVECFALGEGGLRSRFKFIDRALKYTGKRSAGIQVVAYILAGIIGASTVGYRTWVNLGLDNDLKRKELREKDVKELRRDINNNNIKTDTLNSAIDTVFNSDFSTAYHKSAFYKRLLHYNRVDSVSTLVTDSVGKPVGTELVVTRKEFHRFLVHTDSVPSDFDYNAQIELISVVLKPGQYNWRGIYQNQAISFAMEDVTFRKSVENKEVEFSNGSSITCVLEIKKKVDQSGNQKTSGYAVQTVLARNESATSLITVQGERYYRAHRMKKAQLDLFAQNDSTKSKTNKRK